MEMVKLTGIFLALCLCHSTFAMVIPNGLVDGGYWGNGMNGEYLDGVPLGAQGPGQNVLNPGNARRAGPGVQRGFAFDRMGQWLQEMFAGLDAIIPMNRSRTPQGAPGGTGSPPGQTGQPEQPGQPGGFRFASLGKLFADMFRRFPRDPNATPGAVNGGGPIEGHVAGAPFPGGADAYGNMADGFGGGWA